MIDWVRQPSTSHTCTYTGNGSANNYCASPDPAHPQSYAYDGDDTTYFLCGRAWEGDPSVKVSSGYLTHDFGVSKNIVQIKYCNYFWLHANAGASQNSAYGQMYVQTSPDNSTWTTLPGSDSGSQMVNGGSTYEYNASLVVTTATTALNIRYVRTYWYLQAYRNCCPFGGNEQTLSYIYTIGAIGPAVTTQAIII